MKTDAQRQAAYRRRMRDRGYVQLRDWVHVDDLTWIRDQIIVQNAWRDSCWNNSQSLTKFGNASVHRVYDTNE